MFCLGAYTNQFGNMMTHKELHSCVICGNEFNHTKGAVESHVHRVHGLALLEYYDWYILKNPNVSMIKSEEESPKAGDGPKSEEPPAKRVKTRRSEHRGSYQAGYYQAPEEQKVLASFKKWVNKCRY